MLLSLQQPIMRIRLLTTFLVATTLLLSTLGCSKKDDPIRTTTSGTGSYVLDGRTINCQVSANSSSRFTAGQQYDDLQVVLQATPTSPNSEVVRLEFGKPSGQPNTAYTLSSITYFTSSDLAVARGYSNSAAATLTETSRGVFAGTFSATDFSTPNSTITAGTFTKVQL
jgi:hypothetical protein